MEPRRSESVKLRKTLVKVPALAAIGFASYFAPRFTLGPRDLHRTLAQRGPRARSHCLDERLGVCYELTGKSKWKIRPRAYSGRKMQPLRHSPVQGRTLRGGALPPRMLCLRDRRLNGAGWSVPVLIPLTADPPGITLSPPSSDLSQTGSQDMSPVVLTSLHLSLSAQVNVGPVRQQGGELS
jgi:hypothetical protein